MHWRGMKVSVQKRWGFITGVRLRFFTALPARFYSQNMLTLAPDPHRSRDNVTQDVFEGKS